MILVKLLWNNLKFSVVVKTIQNVYLVAMVEVFDELVSAVEAEGMFHFQLHVSMLAALTLAVLTFVSNSILVVLVVLVADLNDALPSYGIYHFMVFTILWKSPQHQMDHVECTLCFNCLIESRFVYQFVSPISNDTILSRFEYQFTTEPRTCKTKLLSMLFFSFFLSKSYSLCLIQIQFSKTINILQLFPQVNLQLSLLIISAINWM